jgi:hypothetical protein
VLGPLVLALDDDTCRQVSQPDSGIGLVNVLSACAGGSKSVDPQVSGVDFDFLDFVCFGQHGHRAGGGMDTPL